MRWVAILAAWAMCSEALAQGAGANTADRVVLGVIDPRPELGLSSLLDEAGAWLGENTALSLVAGDQVGLDRAALAVCPADALYACLARAIAAAPGGVRAGIVVARARPPDVQLLLFDVAELAPVLDDEERVYARVQRVSGPSVATALEGLRARPGFESPARARVEARGCDGCVVRVAATEVAVRGDPGLVEELRVRPGEVRIEVLRRGQILAVGTAQLDPGTWARLRIEAAPQPPAWRPFVASGLVLGGLGALVAGAAVAVGRDARVCVTHEASCDASAAADPRIADDDAADDAVRGLAIGGAVGVAAGVALWALAWLDDDGPQLSIEPDAR